MLGPKYAHVVFVTPESSVPAAYRDSPAARVADAPPVGGATTLETHFQPITAVRRGVVLGVEALTRARGRDGNSISPLALFDAAERDGMTEALDRACRRRALDHFAPLHRADSTLVCFVNCRVTTFLADTDGAHAWSALAAEAQIDPRTIALEVLESQAANLDALAAATAAYRASGFLVVIDDVGAGHSNLDRIAAVRPDLLKADRSLVHGCAQDRVKRAVLRALVGLTEELGGWLVVEGVEREDDALTVLDIGADLLQGYHLGRPAPVASLADLDETRRRTVTLATRHRATTRHRVVGARAQRARRAAFVRATADTIAGCAPECYDAALAGALATAPGDPHAAAAVVLDEAGAQLTPTFRSRRLDARERTLIFRPPGVGTDHALKEYVYLLPEADGATYETAPYVPLPNEKLCVTVSTAFDDVSGARRLLCLHLDAQLSGGPLDGGPPSDALGR